MHAAHESELSAADATADPFDLPDDALRAAWSVKWTLPPAGVLPAWVAEMDARPCPPVLDAVRAAVERGTFGYPPLAATGVPEALATWGAEHYGWDVAPERVVVCGDVMAGVRFALETLCEPAPVVVPVPSYPPLLHVVPLTGRQVVTVPVVDAARRLNVGAVEAAFAAGARTLLLSSPHNPVGRAWARDELEALRDAALRHGARVISDEIHAPLVLPGAGTSPTPPSRAPPSTSRPSRRRPRPGTPRAQVRPDRHRHGRRHQGAGRGAARRQPRRVAARARRDGGRLHGRRSVAGARPGRPRGAPGPARRPARGTAPAVTWVPPEATYLGWLDLGGVDVPDPAATALAEGRVMLSRGPDYGPGLERFARIVFATSAERLERIVGGLVTAWS